MSTLSSLSARLRPVAATHPDARRYAQARRHVLAKSERVTAVHGRWGHERLLSTDADIATVLWCPGPEPQTDADDLASRVIARAGDGVHDLRARAGPAPPGHRRTGAVVGGAAAALVSDGGAAPVCPAAARRRRRSSTPETSAR